MTLISFVSLGLELRIQVCLLFHSVNAYKLQCQAAGWFGFQFGAQLFRRLLSSLH